MHATVTRVCLRYWLFLYKVRIKAFDGIYEAKKEQSERFACTPHITPILLPSLLLAATNRSSDFREIRCDFITRIVYFMTICLMTSLLFWRVEINFYPTYRSSWQILFEFGTENLRLLPPSSLEFNEREFSDCYTLLRSVSEIVPYFLRFLAICKLFDTGFFLKLTGVELRKDRTAKDTCCLEA